METLSFNRKLERARQTLACDYAAEPDDHLCNCGECDGYGHVISDRGARPCPHLVRSEFLRMIDRRMSGNWEDWKPPRFQEVRRRERFHETESFRAVEDLFRELTKPVEPRALLLCGGHGRSKTLAPLILLRECAERVIPCHAIKFPHLVEAYKRGFDGQPYLRTQFGIMEHSRLIFVDEVGRGGTYGNENHALDALFRIVDSCYRTKFLILSSNLQASEFSRWITSEIESRLNPHNGYCSCIREPYKQDLREHNFSFEAPNS